MVCLHDDKAAPAAVRRTYRMGQARQRDREEVAAPVHGTAGGTGGDGELRHRPWEQEG